MKTAYQATWLNLYRQKTEQAVQLYEFFANVPTEKKFIKPTQNDTLSSTRTYHILERNFWRRNLDI